MGGRDQRGLLSEVHVFDLEESNWSNIADFVNPTMPLPVCNHLAVALDSVPSYKVYKCVCALICVFSCGFPVCIIWLWRLT